MRAVDDGLVTVVSVVTPENVGLAVVAIVPVVAGRVSVFVPATAGGAMVIWPDDDPLSVKLPILHHSPS